MNELTRMAYLDALEIDCYVSRTQLPGAAVTRRLAIVPTPVEKADAPDRVKSPDVPDKTATPLQPEGFSRPDFGLGDRKKTAAAEPLREASPGGEPLPRFTLITIVAGNWLWLEELGGMPLATEQVQLVQAMAQALAFCSEAGTGEATASQATKPDTAQFDWPPHTNRQFDLGEEAARAGLAAFVSRRMEQFGCRGLVLLGESCAQRVPLSQMSIPAVTVASSAQMLVDPALKRQVWRDLQPLLQKP
ncbi:MAG: hypothetical protein KDI33_15335 [Halioglobus sp.]|nr:hypothetical protein [Halioglobus sp.]